MDSSLDVHVFDGQLPTICLEVDIETKKIRASEIYDCFNPTASEAQPQALNFLKSIIADIGTPKNYDPTNNLSADDLLSILWKYRENPDFLKELEIQLLDMQTGFCPQGRTHRLYQLVRAFDLE